MMSTTSSDRVIQKLLDNLTATRLELTFRNAAAEILFTKSQELYTRIPGGINNITEQNVIGVLYQFLIDPKGAMTELGYKYRVLRNLIGADDLKQISADGSEKIICIFLENFKSLAIQNPNIALQFLLDESKKIHYLIKHDSALELANQAQALIAKSANPNTCDTQGEPLLHRLFDFGSEKFFKVLTYTRPSIVYPLRTKILEIFKDPNAYKANQDVDINIKNVDGKTALERVLECEQWFDVFTLLQCGADPYTINPVNKLPLFYLLVKQGYTPKESIEKFKIDINKVLQSIMNSNFNAEVAMTLVKWNANPNIQAANGQFLLEFFLNRTKIIGSDPQFEINSSYESSLKRAKFNFDILNKFTITGNEVNFKTLAEWRKGRENEEWLIAIEAFWCIKELIHIYEIDINQILPDVLDRMSNWNTSSSSNYTDYFFIAERLMQLGAKPDVCGSKTKKTLLQIVLENDHYSSNEDFIKLKELGITFYPSYPNLVQQPYPLYVQNNLMNTEANLNQQQIVPTIPSTPINYSYPKLWTHLPDTSLYPAIDAVNNFPPPPYAPVNAHTFIQNNFLSISSAPKQQASVTTSQAAFFSAPGIPDDKFKELLIENLKAKTETYLATNDFNQLINQAPPVPSPMLNTNEADADKSKSGKIPVFS